MKEQEGHIHPINRIYDELVTVFSNMGFEVALDREVEDEFHNFDSLNIPKHHPSRDMQDTFWIKGEDKKLLRTHTSPVQTRYMEKHQPPFKIIAPGKVFRNEATDRTHEAQFHQLEGLVVGVGVSMGHLKKALNTFLKELFGDKAEIRMRPGFFPFVEPGVEIDMVCMRCSGKGCPSCAHNGWIEILGAGMVHPNVLMAAGIDPKKYTGFAFGVGIDRLAMLKYGIDDIRHLYSGDLRLVSQF